MVFPHTRHIYVIHAIAHRLFENETIASELKK